jgi:hypothetical protein
MNLPVIPGQFDWLKNNIHGIRPDTRWVRIQLPHDLHVDMEMLKGVIENNDNARFIVEEGDHEPLHYIEGNIIDPELFKILMQISSTVSIKFSFTEIDPKT